jgi:colanic acid biosynthesis glycosyl transferase WcaI
VARLLIYSLVFPPDGVSTAQLMGELAQDLEATGHDVAAITTEPHYNRDKVAEAAQPLRRLRGGLVSESDFGRIRVRHISMPTGRGRLSGRIRGWLGFHVLGFVLALRKAPAAEVIIVPSPLLTAGVVAWAITKVRGGAYIYNVQELYPDLAIKMGRLRNPLLIWMLRRLERFVYRRSAAVVAISHGIRERVIGGGIPPERVHLIPNFVDLDHLTPLARANEFAREHNLTNAFVVSYAGNIGYAQGLETVLDAAELSGTRVPLLYVLIGDGVRHGHIADQIEQRRLANVIRIPHQPYARIPEIYAASDVCLVPLLGELNGSALPSKIFRVMACARPVIALCNPDSELADLVRAAGAGHVVPTDRPDLLAKAVGKLADDPELRVEMGRSGRAFVEREYTRRAVTQRYARLIEGIVAEREEELKAARRSTTPLGRS